MGICPGCLRREPCPPPGWAFVVVYAVSKHVIPLRLDYIMDASPASSGEWEQSCSQTPVPLRKVSIRGAFLPAPQCYYYLVVVCLFVCFFATSWCPALLFSGLFRFFTHARRNEANGPRQCACQSHTWLPWLPPWGSVLKVSCVRRVILKHSQISLWYTPRVTCDSKETLGSNRVLFKKKEKEKEQERRGWRDEGKERAVKQLEEIYFQS